METGRLAAEESAAKLRPVKSVLNAIGVLEVLAAASRPLGVTEVAESTGMSKTSAYNTLNTFELCGLVSKDRDSSKYKLGWRLFELGSTLLRNHDVIDCARPHLADLAEQVGETVLLAIREGYEALYLDRRAPSRQAIQMVATTGRRSPLHATATGKVLLAAESDDFVRAFADEGLERRTPFTITTTEGLLAQVQRVRESGYATCTEENEPNLCSLAVPLRDYTGETVASLTLAGPSVRFNTAAFKVALEPLQGVARRISGDLGFRGERS